MDQLNFFGGSLKQGLVLVMGAALFVGNATFMPRE